MVAACAPHTVVARLSGDEFAIVVAQATLDFWQNAANGLYWQVDPTQATDNLRCQLKVDGEGRFEIATIRANCRQCADGRR